MVIKTEPFLSQCYIFIASNFVFGSLSCVAGVDNYVVLQRGYILVSDS
jgi:hypothetical protein